MKSQIFSVLLATFICACIVLAAHTIPPLTEPTVTEIETRATSRAAGFSPKEYCASAMTGVDCGCFVQKAGEILSTDRERVLGYAYANPIDLAISQGQEGCSGS